MNARKMILANSCNTLYVLNFRNKNLKNLNILTNNLRVATKSRKTSNTTAP
jgi:hypothetical protein